MSLAMSHRRLTSAGGIVGFTPMLLATMLQASELLVEQRTVGGPGRAGIYPSGVGVNLDGDVVVPDTGNDRVRLYRRDGTLVWTVGEFGNGAGQFNEPRDADIDATGNIYISDNGNRRMVKLTADGQWIKSWKGPDSDRLVATPMGIAVRGNRVYIAESDRQRVRVWNTELDTQIASFASNGVCIFGDVRDVDADADGNVYIGNYPRNEILVLNPDGHCINKWTTLGRYSVRVGFDPVLGRELIYGGHTSGIRVHEKGGLLRGIVGSAGNEVTDWTDPAGDMEPGTFQGLRFFTVDASGDVWAGDLHGYQVEHFARTSSGWPFVQAIPDPIMPPVLADSAAFNKVRNVAFGADGSIHAVDYYNNRLVRFDAFGKVLGACGNRSSMGWPSAVAVDAITDQIWYSAGVSNQLVVLRPDCSRVATISAQDFGIAGFADPKAITLRQSDRLLFVADTFNHRIVVFDVATRRLLTTYGRSGNSEGHFLSPRGIATNPANGNVLVADSKNNRIVELSYRDGAFSWLRSISGGFNLPSGVAADTAGHIYVADTNNQRLVVLDTIGTTVQTIDNLNTPMAVAVNSDDEVFLSDTYNDLIRVYAKRATCDAPKLNPATEAGLFLWEENCGGALRSFSVRALPGGQPTRKRYEGRLDTSQTFTQVSPIRLESNDLLETLHQDRHIHYVMTVENQGVDGFGFNISNSARICFGTSLPTGTLVRVGPGKTPVATPFNPDTREPCSTPPYPVSLSGARIHSPLIEEELFPWE